PEPVTPLGVEVAEPAHLKGQDGLERDDDRRALVRGERDACGAGATGSRLPRHVMVDRGHRPRGALAEPARRRAAAPHVPPPPRRVLVERRVRAALVEVHGSPEPEELRRQARCAGLRLADGTDAPRAIARARRAIRKDRDLLAVETDVAFPETELGEARGVHHEPPLAPPREARLPD